MPIAILSLASVVGNVLAPHLLVTNPLILMMADIVGTLVQLGVLYGTGRSLLHALDPSTRALAILGGGTLLLALTGPAIVVRAAARRRTATDLQKRLAAAAVGG